MLRLEDVYLVLGPTLGLVGQQARLAAVDDLSVQLTSPCLVVGQNGQGKSLIAKVLARASTFQGRAEFTGGHRRSAARLLFQDVMTQTLLRSLKALTHSGAAAEGVIELFDTLRLTFFELQGTPPPAAVWGDAPCLLDVKFMLAAARLGQGPGAMILDEPDWGLSRRDALDFVRAVIVTAHRRQTPVMLISHKPWWQNMVCSRVRVTRGLPTAGHGDRVLFRISLEAEVPAA